MTLKDRLFKYLKSNPTWFPKGQLCDLAREHTGATGEHTGRRLRELREEGKLERRLIKGHCYYKVKVAIPNHVYYNVIHE